MALEFSLKKDLQCHIYLFSALILYYELWIILMISFEGRRRVHSRMVNMEIDLKVVYCSENHAVSSHSTVLGILSHFFCVLKIRGSR
jgi:hypothetical protein